MPYCRVCDSRLTGCDDDSQTKACGVRATRSAHGDGDGCSGSVA